MIKPAIPARIKAPATITRPKIDIQIRPVACLISSGLPEEPRYWIAEINRLINKKNSGAVNGYLKDIA